MSELSIKDFLEKFNAGEFNNESVSVQIEAGWYDWFCSDRSLVNKTRTLGKKVAQIADSPKIFKGRQFVFFKNNCSFNGSLYDSFSICDMKDGHVQFWVCPRNGHNGENKGKAQVYAAPDFKKPVVNGTWNDVKKYFNS